MMNLNLKNFQKYNQLNIFFDMKNLIKYCTILLVFCASSLSAQNISGIVNAYYPVSSVAGNVVTVGAGTGAAHTLAIGDYVVLIQMTGPPPVQAGSNMGNYELRKVTAVSGSSITLDGITKSYTPSTEKVQLVWTPFSATGFTVTATVTAKAWDGTTGGIIALKGNTLTLNASIDATGTGYSLANPPSTTSTPSLSSGQGSSDGRGFGDTNGAYGGGGGGGLGGGGGVSLGNGLGGGIGGGGGSAIIGSFGCDGGYATGTLGGGSTGAGSGGGGGIIGGGGGGGGSAVNWGGGGGGGVDGGGAGASAGGGGGGGVRGIGNGAKYACSDGCSGAGGGSYGGGGGAASAWSGGDDSYGGGGGGSWTGGGISGKNGSIYSGSAGAGNNPVTIPITNSGHYLNTSQPRIMMGGSGGSSICQTEGFGGGIIILDVVSLIGNSFSIKSNGISLGLAPNCPAATQFGAGGAYQGGGTGGAGGGGGGQMLLNVKAFTSNTIIEAKGGKGGDGNTAGIYHGGTGGAGGGGGGIWVYGTSNSTNTGGQTVTVANTNISSAGNSAGATVGGLSGSDTNNPKNNIRTGTGGAGGNGLIVQSSDIPSWSGVCAITLTSAAGACTPATNKYDVTGSLTFSDAPTTGTLTVSDGSITQVFNAPFTSPQAYTLSGLTADGASHTVTAVFSADGACTNTSTYTAPASCAVAPVCAITLTSAAGACTPATNKYNVTGSLTFSTAPSTGTLTVSMGAITQVFNAPFTSPQAYTLSGLTADGASHTVTAVFSADGACTNTSTYTAPASCAVAPVCAITLTSAAGACTPATNKYDVTGSLTFSDAPTTGTLTVSIGAVTQVFNAPFTSPQAYTLSGLTADGASHTVTAVFSADGACTNTSTYTAPASCAVACTTPTFKTVVTQATCAGTTANSDAKISLTNIVNGDKAGYSQGNTYTGSAYSAATAVSGGSAMFSGISNLSGNNVYSVRVFNGSNTCYIDKTVIIPVSDCNTLCLVDGGSDMMICSPTTTVDLKDAAATEEWIAGTGNPAAATINASTGVVSGMSADGIYSFILRDKVNTSCSDIVYVFRSVSTLPNITSCDASYQLPTDGGVTWTAAVGNTASVTSAGLITGMTTDGTYTFTATFGTCTATVDVSKTTCAVNCVTPNAGADFTMCLPKTTTNLTDATSGYEWVAVAGNPAAATINATTGVIFGMTAVGTYKFRLQKTGDATCFDEIQITLTNGDAVIMLCNDGSTSYTLLAQPGYTNIVWYNMAGVQVGTGTSMIVKSTTLGLEDGSEAYYYQGTNTTDGCAGELCCPVKFMTQSCCPIPNCKTVTVIKN